MPNEIEKFDPSTLMQGVKDRIKATFVSLIPDDKWDGLVSKEVDAFFNQQIQYKIGEEKIKDGSFWGKTVKFLDAPASPFRVIVWDFCANKLIDTLKKQITDDYFQGQYQGNKEINEQLKTVIAEAAPMALINLFQSISYNNISDLQRQIQNFR